MLEAVDEGTCARGSGSGSGSGSGRLDVCVLCRSDLMTKVSFMRLGYYSTRFKPEANEWNLASRPCGRATLLCMKDSHMDQHSTINVYLIRTDGLDERAGFRDAGYRQQL